MILLLLGMPLIYRAVEVEAVDVAEAVVAEAVAAVVVGVPVVDTKPKSQVFVNKGAVSTAPLSLN